jgi:hypothetical protein
MASRPMRCGNLRAPSPAAGALAGCNASDIGHGWAYRWDYSWQLSRWCQTYYEQAGARTFYTTGMEHSPTSATGTAWERTPWPATRQAAWEALSARRRATMTTQEALCLI